MAVSIFFIRNLSIFFLGIKLNPLGTSGFFDSVNGCPYLGLCETVESFFPQETNERNRGGFRDASRAGGSQGRSTDIR